MLVGVCFMLFYMLKFKFGWFGGGTKADWWFGISPEGFGTIAMLANFLVTVVVTQFTPETPRDIKKLIEKIRLP
jgi:cation/acetate symporter